jgi:hypothetical protein
VFWTTNTVTSWPAISQNAAPSGQTFYWGGTLDRAQRLVEEYRSETRRSDFWPNLCFYVTDNFEQAMDWAERRAQCASEIKKQSAIPAVIRFVSSTTLDNIQPHHKFETYGTVEVEKSLICNYIAACRKCVNFTLFLKRVEELKLPIDEKIQWISGPMLLNRQAIKDIYDGEKELPKNVVDMCELGGYQICAIGVKAIRFFRLCSKQILVWNLQTLRMFPDKRLECAQRSMDVDVNLSKNEVMS